jgi:hypothetical protein
LTQRVNEGVFEGPLKTLYIFGWAKKVGATANFPPSGGPIKPIPLLSFRNCHQSGAWGLLPPGVPNQSLSCGSLTIPNRSCSMTRKIRFRPVRKRARRHFVEKDSHMPRFEETSIACNFSSNEDIRRFPRHRGSLEQMRGAN